MFATDEELETDGEQYDCETCPVADHLQGLWPENAEAWRIYRLLASRFLVDLHAGGAALTKLTADLDEEPFEDLMQRLAIIYDVLCPPVMAPRES